MGQIPVPWEEDASRNPSSPPGCCCSMDALGYGFHGCPAHLCSVQGSRCLSSAKYEGETPGSVWGWKELLWEHSPCRPHSSLVGTRPACCWICPGSVWSWGLGAALDTACIRDAHTAAVPAGAAGTRRDTAAAGSVRGDGGAPRMLRSVAPPPEAVIFSLSLPQKGCSGPASLGMRLHVLI